MDIAGSSAPSTSSSTGPTNAAGTDASTEASSVATSFGEAAGSSMSPSGSAAVADASTSTSTRQTPGSSSTVAPTTKMAAVPSQHSIVVNPVQTKNPVLRQITAVPWEFGDIIPDFILGKTACALFLSVRYHLLHPQYIHERLKRLGKLFELRVLLVLADTTDCQKVLNELAMISIRADLTMMVSSSYEEAGHYLETYKAYENKPPDSIMERVDSNFNARAVECLTSVKGINKTDAATLINTFKTMYRIMSASKEELLRCPGLGPVKAQRLYDVFHKPFKNPKSQEPSAS